MILEQQIRNNVFSGIPMIGQAEIELVGENLASTRKRTQMTQQMSNSPTLL
jgi:hypothetical protein